MQTAFVERRFESATGEVIARFEVPYLAPLGEYRCRWHLIWEGGERSDWVAGIDGIQALMLAMRSVHALLTESEEYRDGRLTLDGQRDLDLPPSWGSGPLYEAGPPQE